MRVSAARSRPQPLWPANGIDGETGDYLLDPLTPEELLARLRREALPPQRAAELRRRIQRARRPHLGPIDGVDPGKLEEAGWGVVFTAGVEPEIKAALQPLIDHRRQQAGKVFQILEYRGEGKQRFLAQAGSGPGPVDPSKLPYYLLLVGGPEEIPLDFQYQLDVQHAVGRLHFDGPDRQRAYRAYAERVVAAEAGSARRPRKAVLFGTANPNDTATQLTHEHLLQPLGRFLGRRPGPWEIAMVAGAKAVKERLVRLLGREAPALLLAALHGVGFRADDPRQRLSQGALLCQDWKGPGSGISPSCYVTAGDLDGEADVSGLVVLLFACFGAGTPEHNGFVHRSPQEPAALAPRPFIAALPQKLLSRGALAVVGHVDRLWGYSFYWPGSGEHLPAFQDALGRLLAGKPVGWAMEPFNLRYAELAAALLDGSPADLLDEIALRTACRDARNYVVLGDPAVRLPTA
jgi:hypothetical protein